MSKAKRHKYREKLQRRAGAETPLARAERKEFAWQHSFDHQSTFPNEGRANIYTCEKCDLVMWTVDLIKGVTPFLTSCRRVELCNEACDGWMQSGMYRVCMTTLLPDYVWYRPSLTELPQLAPPTQEHVRAGGLILARVQERQLQATPPLEVG